MKIFYVLTENNDKTYISLFSTLEFAEKHLDQHRAKFSDHSVHDAELDTSAEIQVAEIAKIAVKIVDLSRGSPDQEGRTCALAEERPQGPMPGGSSPSAFEGPPGIPETSPVSLYVTFVMRIRIKGVYIMPSLGI